MVGTTGAPRQLVAGGALAHNLRVADFVDTKLRATCLTCVRGSDLADHMHVRALQRRVKRLETGAKPKPSPFTIWFGSFDSWVELHVLPGIESGALDGADMIVIVAALRGWEADGLWDSAYAR